MIAYSFLVMFIVFDYVEYLLCCVCHSASSTLLINQSNISKCSNTCSLCFDSVDNIATLSLHCLALSITFIPPTNPHSLQIHRSSFRLFGLLFCCMPYLNNHTNPYPTVEIK